MDAAPKISSSALSLSPFPNYISKHALHPHFPYPSSVVNISFSVRYDTSVSSGNDDGIDFAFIIIDIAYFADSAAERRSFDQSVTRTHHSIGQFRSASRSARKLRFAVGEKINLAKCVE